MKDDITITPLHQPGSILDPLTEIAREGARQMLAAALRAEAASFVAQFEDERLLDGRHRIVRHGTGPERMIQTGIGPIPVQRQKVRDRASGVPAEKRIRFSSNILPRWARRSKSLDALLPVLYLRGISTGDFQEALTALLGTDAPNLSPGAISRLTAGWQENYDRWQRRDLSVDRDAKLTPILPSASRAPAFAPVGGEGSSTSSIWSTSSTPKPALSGRDEPPT